MLKNTFALWLRGDRARRALAAAQRDLDAMPLPEAVALRIAVPAARKRCRTSLRIFRAALAGLVAGETHPCLPRALALLAESRACGFEPSLVVGVRKSPAGIESHAWLSLDGRPFLEAHETPERYETITVLPPAGHRPRATPRGTAS